MFQAAAFIHNKDTERTLTAKEAIQQGYVPCVRCMRKYLQTAIAGHIALGVGSRCAHGLERSKTLNTANH